MSEQSPVLQHCSAIKSICSCIKSTLLQTEQQFWSYILVWGLLLLFQISRLYTVMVVYFYHFISLTKATTSTNKSVCRCSETTVTLASLLPKCYICSPGVPYSIPASTMLSASQWCFQTAQHPMCLQTFILQLNNQPPNSVQPFPTLSLQQQYPQLTAVQLTVVLLLCHEPHADISTFVPALVPFVQSLTSTTWVFQLTSNSKTTDITFLRKVKPREGRKCYYSKNEVSK